MTNIRIVVLQQYSVIQCKQMVQFDLTGREIVPSTGANATKFFTLASKSWKLVAKLARDIVNKKEIFKDKFAANFLVKFFSITQYMHLDW